MPLGKHLSDGSERARGLLAFEEKLRGHEDPMLVRSKKLSVTKHIELTALAWLVRVSERPARAWVTIGPLKGFVCILLQEPTRGPHCFDELFISGDVSHLPRISLRGAAADPGGRVRFRGPRPPSQLTGRLGQVFCAWCLGCPVPSHFRYSADPDGDAARRRRRSQADGIPLWTRSCNHTYRRWGYEAEPGGTVKQGIQRRDEAPRELGRPPPGERSAFAPLPRAGISSTAWGIDG